MKVGDLVKYDCAIDGEIFGIVVKKEWVNERESVLVAWTDYYGQSDWLWEGEVKYCEDR